MIPGKEPGDSEVPNLMTIKRELVERPDRKYLLAITRRCVGVQITWICVTCAGLDDTGEIAHIKAAPGAGQPL
jgi:hypothetical protein